MVVLTFPREADMTAVLLRAAGTLNCESWSSFLEFEAPQGMPDIVFARFSEDALEARMTTPLSQPLLCWREAAVIAVLTAKRPVRLGEIAARARMSEGTALAALRALRAADAVDTDGQRWRANSVYPSPLGEALAVELKLADWRRALGQAVRYQAFAERAYVVLPEERTASVTAGVSSFRLYNVGLAALSPWGSADLLTRPRRRRPLDPVARFVASERLWEAYRRRAPAQPLAA